MAKAATVGVPYETENLHVRVHNDRQILDDESADAPVMEVPAGLAFPEDPGNWVDRTDSIMVSGEDARRWRDVLDPARRFKFTSQLVRAADGVVYVATVTPIMPGDEAVIRLLSHAFRSY